MLRYFSCQMAFFRVSRQSRYAADAAAAKAADNAATCVKHAPPLTLPAKMIDFDIFADVIATPLWISADMPLPRYMHAIAHARR